MQRGDLVTATYMPHLGLGLIEWVSPDNHLVVSFEVDGKQYSDDFDENELEMVTRIPVKT